ARSTRAVSLPDTSRASDKKDSTPQYVRRLLRCGISIRPMFALGRVSRAPTRVLAARNCTRDEGGPFGFGDQVLISSHRKLLRSKAVGGSVEETPEQDPSRQGRERRAKANRRRSVESGLGDAKTGGGPF